MSAKVARARYGTLADVPPEEWIVDGVPCRVQRIRIDDLVEWREARGLRPVRVLEDHWPPAILYEPISDTGGNEEDTCLK